MAKDEVAQNERLLADFEARAAERKGRGSKPIPAPAALSDLYVVACPSTSYAGGTWSVHTDLVYVDKQQAEAVCIEANAHLQQTYPTSWMDGRGAYQVLSLDDLLGMVYDDGRHDGEHPYEG